MRKLIFSDIFKNQKLFIGTIISVTVSIAIIITCMNLVMGALQGNNYGHRFENVDIVITHKPTIEKTYMDGDDEERENEEVDGIIYFTQSEINTLNQTYDVVEDITFYTAIDGLSNNVSGHNSSSMILSDFQLVEGSMPTTNEVLIDVRIKEELSIEVGQNINIKTRNGSSTYTVSGIVDSSIEDIYEIQYYLFFTDSDSRLLSNGVSSIAFINADVESMRHHLKSEGYQVYTYADSD